MAAANTARTMVYKIITKSCMAATWCCGFLVRGPRRGGFSVSGPSRARL